MRLVKLIRLPRSAGAARKPFALPLLVAAAFALASVPMLDPAVSGMGRGAPLGDPERGEELFGQTGCNGCHMVNGVGGQVGPDLTRVFRLDLSKDRPGQKQANITEYVRESIHDPQAYIVPSFPEPSPMPSAELFELSEQNIDDLIAFLKKAAELHAAN